MSLVWNVIDRQPERKGGKVRFVEVKGTGDTLHESQFSHVEHFVRRLNLDYSVSVVVSS